MHIKDGGQKDQDQLPPSEINFLLRGHWGGDTVDVVKF